MLALQASGSAQHLSGPETVNTYSIAQKRLLINNTVQFVKILNQNDIEADSAMSMARLITQLPFLLPYTEGLDSSQSESTDLINTGRIAEAKEVLKTLDGQNKIQLLIKLAIWYIHQPGNHKKDIDSTNRYIHLAAALSISGKYKDLQNECLLLQGELNYQTGSIAKSKIIYLNLLLSAEKEGNLLTMANVSQQLGRMFFDNDSIKLIYFNRALSLYRELKLKEKEIEQLFDIMNVYRRVDYIMAQKYILRVLALQQSNGFKHVLYSEYILSLLNLMSQQSLTGLNYAKAAFENMKWSGFKELAPTFMRRVGGSYTDFDKNEEALSWFRQGIAYRYICSHIFWYKSFLLTVQWLCDLGRSKSALDLVDSITKEFPPLTVWEKMDLLGAKGQCYQKLGNDRMAEESFEAFYTLYTKFPRVDPNHELYGHLFVMGNYFVSKGNLMKARLFLKASYSNTSHTSPRFGMVEKYSLLYKIDSITGNYASALQHHIRYKYYFDLDRNMDQRKMMDELTVKYVAEKKDQDIRLLKQQGIIQQAKLKQNSFIHSITLAAVVLLVIISSLLFNQYLVKQRANSAINKKNIALRKLLAEKEWLLKEVHHRVKNNLQTVVSLLELQSDFLDNEALSAIHDSQNRIYAMSLIHQKLYQSDNISSINMRSYLQALTGHLRKIFNSSYQIKYNLEVIDIDLDVSQAFPIGLIVNEAVTNSIKYAFTPSSNDPEVTILLHKEVGGLLVLTIADNGTGLPANFHSADRAGLGFKLMTALVEDIEGELTINSANGTQIIISFNASLPLHQTGWLLNA
ncbi:MAG: sensor histidine kinase [Chitinophagaceae bacterium]